MSTKSKTRLAKIVSVFVGVAMVLSVVAPASAVTIEELQAQIALLTSQLASLQGSTPTAPTSNGWCRPNGQIFGTTLNIGSRGTDVLMLQQMLNQNSATLVASTGAGSPGSETNYYGSLTAAAVGKLQTANAASILAPLGLSSANAPYPFGPATRNFVNSLPACGSVPTNPTNPTTPVVGSVTVSLAPSSPAASALISGQAIADLAHFNFTNLSGAPVTVTNVQLMRTGISNDATLSNVYLYDGVTRLTDSAGISNGIVTLNQPSGLFTIPAGSTRTISVRSDIAASTAGQIVGVSLTSATVSGTAIAGTPVAGANHSIATATLASGDWSGSVTPATNSVEPQNDFVVWQSTLSVNTRALNLGAFALRQVGSINQAQDLRNFRLYVDGVEVAQTANIDANGYVTFNANNRRLETGGRVIRVVADIVSGASKTFSFQLRQSSDAMLVDSGLNQPIVATVGSNTFSSQNSGTMTIASSTGGSVSVTKSNDSPTGNITAGATSQKFATFEFRASGENMKIENLNVRADGSSSVVAGLDNAKVFVNGIQVGSTKDLTDANADGTGDTVNFTFGSSFIVPAGETAIVDIYADAKSSTAASYSNGDTMQIYLVAGSSNAQGMSSLQSKSVPASATGANQLTLTTSSLTATKFSGYGDQTFVAGTNNAKLGSFVLSTGSSEGVNVNTITIALSSDEAATVTNLWLRDASTGAQIGTVKITPSTSNAYALSVDIPVSGTKTIDVVGNIIAGSNAGPWTAQITADGTGSITGTSATASSATLQTITVGSGSLDVSRSGNNPSNANAIAGGAQVKAGVYKLTAINTAYTLQEIKIKVPNGAATSVANVTIKYQDQSGSTKTSTQALTVGTEAYATATFTGLTMYVPKDDTADLEVWVAIPTIASGATSGTGISVVVDYDEGFKAQPTGGTVLTSPSTVSGTTSADLSSNDGNGKGITYVKKSVPVIAQLANSGSPASTKAIYKFTVTADSAGDIELRKMNFTITTTVASITAVQLKNETTGTTVDSGLAPDGSGDVTVWSGGQQNSDTVETVGAGQTVTYGLYGTVTGWTSSASLSVNLKEDTSAVTTASSASLSDNFIWSDRSITGAPHTTITADWTNGYLIEEIPGVTSW